MRVFRIGWTHVAGLLGILSMGLIVGPAAADDIYVIEAGRENDVLGLLAPYSLGSDIEGWTLERVAIEATFIDVVILQDNTEASLRLAHVGEDGEPSSASFSMTPRGPEAASAPLEALIETIVRNDAGDFWRVRAAPSPASELAHSGPFDGLLAVFFLLLGLTCAAFRVATKRLVLGGILLVACLYRLWLSPHSLLGAWFYSRTTPVQRAIEGSASMRWLNVNLGGEWAEIDILIAIGIVFAFITPLAVFLHARFLLGDEKRALTAAALLAILPAHIRFSASEVAFIPSIVFSSTLFASAHGVMKGSRRIAAVSALSLIVMSIATLYARPLNVLFVALLGFYVIFVEGDAPRRRRVLAIALPLLCAIPITATHLVGHYGENIRDGASLSVLADAFALLFDGEKNTLINFHITPWALIFMIVGGFILAAKSQKAGEGAFYRGQSGRRVAFLFVWLGVFFATHAYVVPASAAVQARYHLHLAVPFVFLASLGLHVLYSRSKGAALLLALSAAAAPLVHREFIEDVGFNDLEELAFVRDAQGTIPEGCQVIEYAATDMDARFRRGGLVLADGHFSLPYDLVVVRPGDAPPRPMGCTWIYEGLSCLSEKDPGEPIAPECAALLRAASVSAVVSTRFQSRIYDGNLARGFSPGTDRIQLTLYRTE